MGSNQELYSGKAKTLYKTKNPDELIMLFRNDTSAFDGEKTASLSGKGKVNNYFNAHIMTLLASQDVPTGFIKILSEQESLVKNLTMLPVECVVRNYTAGSICRRYGIKPELELKTPLIEFFLKNDELHDPLINEQHIELFNWASGDEVEQIKLLALKTNKVLLNHFDSKGLILVDIKLEFGKHNGQLYLGDEFTPDGCRIWDKETKSVYDKDLFRKGIGDLVSGYKAAADKLGIYM